MKLRSLFKCHGGKFYLAKWIISNFPKDYENLNYYEGCFGGGSVLLQKNKSISESCNDLDHNIIGIIRCLTDDPKTFIDLIQKIEYTEDEFEWSKTVSELSADITRFVAELVRRRFSRGGLRKAFSWSERLRGGIPGDRNAWETYKQQLPLIADRLKDVKVYSMPVEQLVKEKDAEDVLWYIDPPYLPSTRQSPDTYTIEMAEAQHISLAEVLNKAKGKVLLSGYPSPLYNKLYSDWTLECKPVSNHSSQRQIKEKRIECLWKNY